MHKDMVSISVNNSQRDAIEDASVHAVPRSIVDIVSRQNELLAEKSKICGEKQPLEPRESAKPEDMEQARVRAPREPEEAHEIRGDARDFRGKSRCHFKAADEIVQFHSARAGVVCR
jgi:hypothetical protein